MTEAEKQQKAKEVADRLNGVYSAEIIWANDKKDAVIIRQCADGPIKIKRP